VSQLAPQDYMALTSFLSCRRQELESSSALAAACQKLPQQSPNAVPNNHSGGRNSNDSSDNDSEDYQQDRNGGDTYLPGVESLVIDDRDLLSVGTEGGYGGNPTLPTSMCSQSPWQYGGPQAERSESQSDPMGAYRGGPYGGSQSRGEPTPVIYSPDTQGFVDDGNASSFGTGWAPQSSPEPVLPTYPDTARYNNWYTQGSHNIQIISHFSFIIHLWNRNSI